MARLRSPAPAAPPVPKGLRPPPELLDPDAEVWADWSAYLAYMSQRGWVRCMEARDRLRVVDPALAGQLPRTEVSPRRREGRRWRAARAWGESVGVGDVEALRSLLGVRPDGVAG